MEQRRSDIGLLDDDARQGLLDEQSQLAEAIAHKVAERDRHNGRLDHFKRVVIARSDLAQAEAQAAAARSAREAAADDYRSLAEFDLIEPLRPLSVDLDNARRTATEAKSRLDELLVAREDARTLDEAAATRLSDATTADEAAEDIFKRFGPLWSEAEKLDAELATARTEFDDATEKSQQAETTLRDHVDALAALDQNSWSDDRIAPHSSGAIEAINLVAFFLPTVSTMRWPCWRSGSYSNGTAPRWRPARLRPEKQPRDWKAK